MQIECLKLPLSYAVVLVVPHRTEINIIACISLKENIAGADHTLKALHEIALGKKATIHQVTTMLSTSKHDLFPGHDTSADDWSSGDN